METQKKDQVIIFVLYGLSTLLAFAYIAFEHLCAQKRSGIESEANVIIDSVLSNRFYIFAALAVQVLVVILFRKTARLVCMLAVSVGIIAFYVEWWITTYRTVAATESLSYSHVDHFLYLGQGNVFDLLILICVVIATLFIVKILIFSNPQR